MIKVVSFDVDGTLVLPDFNDFIWFEVLPQLYAEKKSLNIKKAKDEVFKEYNRIGADDCRWYSLDFWLDYFRLDLDQNSLLDKYADKVTLYPDVLPSLGKLSLRYDLVVGSGMPDDFIEIKMRKDNIKRFFKRMFSSISKFGLVKKDGGFYTRMCQELGVEPPQLVHIGDHYQVDYLAALQAGALALHLDRKHEGEKHLGTIYDLNDLEKKLEARFGKLL
jgi:putative hydrolase of the HAD superfamily